MLDKQQCTYCSKYSGELLYCARCDDGYCNQSCQKSDWPRHRYICFQMPKLLAKAQKLTLDDGSVTKPEDQTEPTRSTKVQNCVVIEDVQVKPPMTTPAPIQKPPPTPAPIQKPPPTYTKDPTGSATTPIAHMRKQYTQQNNDVSNMPSRENFNMNKQMHNDRNNNSTNFSGRMGNGQPAYSRSFPRPKLDVSGQHKPVEKPKEEMKPICDTKWKSFKPIVTNFGDYFEVIVRHVDRAGTDVLMNVTLTQYEDELKQFGDEIAKSHRNKESIKRSEFDEIGVGSLLIVANGDCLQRAEVLKVNYGTRELKVKSIDYGMELHIKDMSSVKLPNDFVYSKEKFCIPVQAKSLNKNVEIGDRIEIKVNAREMGNNGVTSVEVKEPAKILKDADNKSKQMDLISGVAQKHMSAMKSRAEPVSYFNRDLDYTQLPTDKSFVATIMDATFLLDHKLVTVAENNDECKKFYEFIPERINNYITSLKANEDSYAPKIKELVLAKFDGEFYRGYCMDIKDDDYEIFYLDYGNFGLVRKEDIRKFPQDLLFPVRAHTCCIKNLDPEKMLSTLESGQISVESVESNDICDTLAITIGYPN